MISRLWWLRSTERLVRTRRCWSDHESLILRLRPAEPAIRLQREIGACNLLRHWLVAYIFTAIKKDSWRFQRMHEFLLRCLLLKFRK